MGDVNVEKIKVTGDVPAPRFGHTLTLISKNKAVLFGGAIGDSGKFVITNEAYLFEFTQKRWKKLDCKGHPPAQRAAHSSTSIENMQMAV